MFFSLPESVSLSVQAGTRRSCSQMCWQTLSRFWKTRWSNDSFICSICCKFYMQRFCRSFLVHHLYQKQIQSAIVLQAGVRRMIAEKRYRRIKLEVWFIICARICVVFNPLGTLMISIRLCMTTTYLVTLYHTSSVLLCLNFVMQ